MGVSTAGHISGRLMAHGMASDTPVAVVENGTLPDERVLRSSLGSLGKLVDEHGVTGPALIVIGAVAAQANVNALPTLAQAVG